MNNYDSLTFCNFCKDLTEKNFYNKKGQEFLKCSKCSQLTFLE